MYSATSKQNSLLQGEMFGLMKIPKAIGRYFPAKTSDNWPIFKVPSNNLLKVLYTQRGNDQKSNEASQYSVSAFQTGKSLPIQINNILPKVPPAPRRLCTSSTGADWLGTSWGSPAVGFCFPQSHPGESQQEGTSKCSWRGRRCGAAA